METLRQQILARRPTRQQENAIFADDLEFLLRAAPGSGKTWTSCRRFIWRGANRVNLAGGLALLSFTNVAVREFQLATAQIGRRDLISDPNYIGTFDSFVERFILTPFGHLVSGTATRPKLLIAPRYGQMKNNKLAAWATSKAGKQLRVPAWQIIPYRDGKKVGFKTNNKLGGLKLKVGTDDPVRELMKLGFYTHSQRVYWAARLLFDRPHIADVIARRFPEIIVDEAQDTNEWLISLLKLLRNKGTKITFVGDPDQCIFDFALANAEMLPAVVGRWQIPEMPLSKSFRCNNQIATAVRNIGGNKDFQGCGEGPDEYHGPFVCRDPGSDFERSISLFEDLLRRTQIQKTESAIICRAHDQLQEIRGEATYTHLVGEARRLAEASFMRDCRKNYKKAYQMVEASIRSIVDNKDLWDKVDDFPDSEEAIKIRLAIWRFVKNETGLPPVRLPGGEWIDRIRDGLTNVITEIGIQACPNLNPRINKKGLKTEQMELPLLQAKTLFPEIRQDTIHQVKGESIDAVLVLGSVSFWNSVVKAAENGLNTEDKRLAYVAMTRSRHVLLVSLPAAHYVKKIRRWKSWGFREL
jgi:superfamily I DNA/RNA helicase